MVFASYTRKSIYSDKSDSTKNQAKMCRDYVDFHYPGRVDSFLVYEDEGLTGSNTKRPDLQRLMKDIKSGLIDFLIVYQLDRLSRDIKDFSNIYAFLAVYFHSRKHRHKHSHRQGYDVCFCHICSDGARDNRQPCK